MKRSLPLMSAVGVLGCGIGLGLRRQSSYARARQLPGTVPRLVRLDLDPRVFPSGSRGRGRRGSSGDARSQTGGRPGTVSRSGPARRSCPGSGRTRSRGRDDPDPERADGRRREPGLVEHCLDCQRQASTYNYCHFEKAALEAAVGPDNLDKAVTMRVNMTAKESRNSVPDDPNAPQPDGGFTHKVNTCASTRCCRPSSGCQAGPAGHTCPDGSEFQANRVERGDPGGVLRPVAEPQPALDVERVGVDVAGHRSTITGAGPGGA